MIKFKFSDIGEGLHEGVVADIYKQEGAKVKEGEALFSVETDKVTSDIPSPATGVITKVLIKPGQTIRVGEEIFYIDEVGGSSSTQNNVSIAKENKTEAISESKGASVVGEVETSDEVISFRKSISSNKASNINPNKMQSSSNFEDKPENRRRIIRANFFAKLNNQSTLNQNTNAEQLIQVSQPIANTQTNLVHEKISPIRKAIAKAMTNSWKNVAYTNLVSKVNVTKLYNLRKNIWEKIYKETEVKLSFLPFIVRAITIALNDFPIMGAKYDEPNQEILIPNYFNIGIAVDTKDGLMVPVVTGASKMSTFEIGKEIIRLAEAARTKTIKPNEMKNADFTITNYGSVGSLFGTPVINYPELAIAGIGAFIDEPILENDKVVMGKAMYLTIAADHRWIDGATIGRFASKVKELLETPELLGVY